VRINLVRDSGEQTEHQIGIAQPRTVLVFAKCARTIDREPATEPRIAATEELGHFIKQISVQRSA